MSYIDGLTGRIDATTAANRRSQRLSNTAPTASIYLFNDSMSAQGKSQTSSIASRNAWQNPLSTATNTAPIVRNIHQQRGGGLNTDQSGRSGGRGLSRENSEMSLTLMSDNETIQSQLTRVERNQAALERLVITQNAKLDRQSAEMQAQKEEMVLIRNDQIITANSAERVAGLVEKLMMRMVDMEGEYGYKRMLSQERAIAGAKAKARKRTQLSTPTKSPAKSTMGLETPESYMKKRQEAMAAAAEADKLAAAAEADRLAMLVTTGPTKTMPPTTPT
jgi:hypothetical protein